MRYLAILFVLFTLPAEAACVCRCVGGTVQAICSSPLDIRPICPPRICPFTPPSTRPIVPPVVPPIGTRRCFLRQVYDPYIRRYVWRRLCR